MMEGGARDERFGRIARRVIGNAFARIGQLSSYGLHKSDKSLPANKHL